MDKHDKILLMVVLVATHAFAGITSHMLGVHEAIELVDQVMVCEPRDTHRHGH